MFVYTKKMQLALMDKLRRGGLMAGAGVMLLIGAGLLLAALWTWLAYSLGWGALWASLAIGLGFFAIGLILMLVGARERHPTPSPDELRAEIQERASMMTDAAIAKVSGAADAALHRASEKVSRVMGVAGQRAQSLSDRASYEADRYADRAEAHVQTAARRTREALEDRLGGAADRRSGEGASNTAAIAPLIGAFAVGLTLASRLRRGQHDDDDRDDHDDRA